MAELTLLALLLSLAQSLPRVLTAQGKRFPSTRPLEKGGGGEEDLSTGAHSPSRVRSSPSPCEVLATDHSGGFSPLFFCLIF